jgi:hypothetical protein
MKDGRECPLGSFCDGSSNSGLLIRLEDLLEGGVGHHEPVLGEQFPGGGGAGELLDALGVPDVKRVPANSDAGEAESDQPSRAKQDSAVSLRCSIHKTVSLLQTLSIPEVARSSSIE